MAHQFSRVNMFMHIPSDNKEQLDGFQRDARKEFLSIKNVRYCDVFDGDEYVKTDVIYKCRGTSRAVANFIQNHGLKLVDGS